MIDFNIADYPYLNQPVLIDLIKGLNLKLVEISEQPRYSYFTFDNGDGLTANISDNFHNFGLTVSVNNRSQWELSQEKGKVYIKGYMSGYRSGETLTFYSYISAFIRTFTIRETIKLFMKKELTKSGIKYAMGDDGYIILKEIKLFSRG